MAQTINVLASDVFRVRIRSHNRMPRTSPPTASAFCLALTLFVFIELWFCGVVAVAGCVTTDAGVDRGGFMFRFPIQSVIRLAR